MKLRIKIEGVSYDVEVEVLDAGAAAAVVVPHVATPAAAPAGAPASARLQPR